MVTIGTCPPPVNLQYRTQQEHYTTLLSQCPATTQLRQIHARALRTGVRHPRLWNTLARAYAEDSASHLALLVCLQMEIRDNYTFPLAFRLCSLVSAFQHGFCLHAHLLKLGLASDVHSLNALLSLYCDSGRIGFARRLFDGIHDRTVASWTAMISGYERNGNTQEAMELFCQMCEDGVDTDEAALLSVLSACTRCGFLDFGQSVHARAIVGGFGFDLVGLTTVLVDMYAKAGEIGVSKEVFDRMTRRNVLSWSAMIGGLAMHGRGTEALELFFEMLETGLKPTAVTMTNVLSACSHSGLVEEGMKYFNLTKDEWSIKPRIEHYGCMVDLLGRAGLLQQAYDFIRTMPIDPTAVLWRSLLGSACTHGDLETGELAMDRLAKLEKPVSGDYVMLANLYARFDRWEDVGRVRTTMNDSNLRKEAGYSSVEVNGTVHKFVMGDRSHPQTHSMYEMLRDVDTVIRRKSMCF